MSKIWLYWNIFIPLQIEVRQTSFLRKLKNEFSIFKSPNRDLTICDTRRHLGILKQAFFCLCLLATLHPNLST